MQMHARARNCTTRSQQPRHTHASVGDNRADRCERSAVISEPGIGTPAYEAGAASSPSGRFGIARTRLMTAHRSLSNSELRTKNLEESAENRRTNAFRFLRSEF